MPQFQIITQAPLVAFISIFFLIGGVVLLLFGVGIIQSGEGDSLIIRINAGRGTTAVGGIGILLGIVGIIFSASISAFLQPTPTPISETGKNATIP